MPGLKGRLIQSRMSAPVGVVRRGILFPGLRPGLDDRALSGPHLKAIRNEVGNDKAIRPGLSFRLHADGVEQAGTLARVYSKVARAANKKLDLQEA
jgi:hypothetical protein